MFSSCTIAIGGETLHYLVSGSGSRVVVAFHGYGLDATIFDDVAGCLGEDYTFISVDLPHHGQSSWLGSPFNRHLLIHLVDRLAVKYGSQKVSLLGYSMGGRVCMMLAALAPARITGMVLVAPDGLVFNLPYYLATSNYFGKQLFAGVLAQPRGFFMVADWLLRRKLLNVSKHKFVTKYLETKAARELLGRVWHDLSDIVPDPRRIRTVIKKYSMPVTIFMGQYDSIIPPGYAERFSEGLESVEVFTLQKGHKLLDAGTAPEIARAIEQIWS